MGSHGASAKRLHTVRGPVLAPHAAERRVDFLDDALIAIDRGGTIASVAPATAEARVPVTWPGTVLVPGFVDTHVHFPQTRVLGSASGPLLDWLARSVYPEEARFADPVYAAAVAEGFCTALLAQGTTTAAIFSSSHPQATDVLFAALDRHGLRAQAGLTLMNRAAPPELLLDTGPALDACRALIARWHGHDRDRLRFCLTPRFALACDSALMRGAADLAEEHGLLVQTHLSENGEELRQTAAAFPDAADYLAVYDHHGLLGGRSLFAHCIHLSDGEQRRLAAADAAVAHCPDSNFFLGSGTMPLDAVLGRGIRVGLGTDVGAGRTFALPRIASRAYDAALLRGEPVTPETLLWLATRGGALALGFGDRVGCVAPGCDADLVAIEVPDGLRGDRLLDALLFRHDAAAVRATVIRGQLRWSAGLVEQV